jgi:ABC-type polysaccharide transport system permease subunit
VDHKPQSIRPGYKTQDDTKVYLSLVVLFAVLFVSVAAFGRELIISLKSGNLAMGLSSAPWVGLRNYVQFINSVAFVNILRNTFVFNLLFAGMSFVLTVLLGYLMTALPKVLKGIIAAFFGLLLFLPNDIFAGWVIHLAGSELFANADAMRLFHPFLCAVKYLGIPLLLVYIRDEIYLEKDSLTPVKSAGLFVLVSLVFITSSFFTLSNAFGNPLSYESMDMLDTFTYRRGLMGMDAGISSAVGVLRILVTIVSAAILFLPVFALFRSTFNGKRKEASEDSMSGRLISAIMAFILFAAVFFLPYLFKGYSFDLGSLNQSANLVTPVITFILVSAISAAIATAFAAAMSKAFLSVNRGIRITAGTLLTLITTLSISPFRYSSYLTIRNLGLFNTVYAIIALTGFSSAAVWAMVCMQRDDHRTAGNSFFLSCLAIFFIQAALVYGNSTMQTIYLTRPQISPLLILRHLYAATRVGIGTEGSATFDHNGIFSLYGFLASLPPMLMFLATYVFLPKDKLLAVISAGVKN